MKNVLVIHLGRGDEIVDISFLGQTIRVERVGCGGDIEQATLLISAYDGRVDAIGLEGMPASIQLGGAQRPHLVGETLSSSARISPVVDGSGVRTGLERWGVTLADRAQPGIFSQKRILLVPGLNHDSLAQALKRHSENIRYADPVVYFALPDFPGIGGRRMLKQVAGPHLEQLKDAPFRRITPATGQNGDTARSQAFRSGLTSWQVILARSAAMLLFGWIIRRLWLIRPVKKTSKTCASAEYPL